MAEVCGKWTKMVVCCLGFSSYFCKLFMDTSSQIETLKRLVCEAAGCEAQSPADFYNLTAFIEGRTREIIGLSTVKRLWQYKGLATKPRQATLNVLAQSIGYSSFDDFCTHYGSCSPSSDIVLGQNLKATDLFPSEQVMLRWNPGREIIVEYLGNSTFRVIKSDKSKLSVDDTFQAAFFAIGHSSMLANVIHGDSSWPLYEIGQVSGLTFIRRLSRQGE